MIRWKRVVQIGMLGCGLVFCLSLAGRASAVSAVKPCVSSYVTHVTDMMTLPEGTLITAKQQELIWTVTIWDKQQKASAVAQETLAHAEGEGEAQALSSENVDVEPASVSQPVISGFVVGDTGASSDTVAYANEVWNVQIPAHIRTRLEQSGWSVVVSGESVARRFGYGGSLMGMTDFSKKTIYLDDRKAKVASALCHEVGHAIDAIGCYPSDSPTFLNLMSQETVYAVDGDTRGNSDHKECFANIVQYILQYGDTYASYSPQLYAFVHKYIDC